MPYFLKRSRRKYLNSKNLFLHKNHVFKSKSSRRPQSLCVKLTKLPPYDKITCFDGMRYWLPYELRSVYIYTYTHIYIYAVVSKYVYIWKTELMEERQFLFACCKWNTETANFRLFAANGNGNRKFVYLGRQTINSNERLLFQQKWPLFKLATASFVPWESPSSCR